jgi:hypothetical protein
MPVESFTQAQLAEHELPASHTRVAQLQELPAHDPAVHVPLLQSPSLSQEAPSSFCDEHANPIPATAAETAATIANHACALWSAAIGP